MFNIRVYGLLITQQKQLLVSDEWIRGAFFTKFPGGGLELGEGTRDCLKREFKEELNLEVEVGEHFYTTDFYIRSAFNANHQIISIYYFVEAKHPLPANLRNKPFEFDEDQVRIYEQRGEVESFRLISWDELHEGSVHLPIDKVVVKLLKEKAAGHLHL